MNFRNQFKCGAFFMSLPGQSEELRWLGALPDMLHKPAVRRSRQLMRSMGNLHRKSFRVIPGFCNEFLANARCFAIVSQEQRGEIFKQSSTSVIFFKKRWRILPACPWIAASTQC